MIQPAITEKIIGAIEAQRFFGKILDGVKAGDKFVVEERGEPIAAVVPLTVYTSWKKARKTFFNRMREISKAINLSPDEADTVAQQAVKAVRTTANKMV